MFLTIGRTLKSGWNNFFRNGYLSVAAVSVMLLSLFTISSVIILVLAINTVLKNMEDNINISVYFKTSVPEENILKYRDELQNYNEIRSVTYVNRDQALENFKKSSADTPSILKALDEIGDNPLSAYLVVQANDPSQYEMISEYLSNASFRDDILRINYARNKDNINKLNGNITSVRRIGLWLAGLFSVISLLIISNTVRITIYTHRKEVEVMRLVGASNTFIRLPFIFEGIIYGFVASLISMLLLFIVLKTSASSISQRMPNVSLVSLYLSNFGLLLGVQLLFGAFLGSVSSWFAVRKYLKI